VCVVVVSCACVCCSGQLCLRVCVVVVSCGACVVVVSGACVCVL